MLHKTRSDCYCYHMMVINPHNASCLLAHPSNVCASLLWGCVGCDGVWVVMVCGLWWCVSCDSVWVVRVYSGDLRTGFGYFTGGFVWISTADSVTVSTIVIHLMCHYCRGHINLIFHFSSCFLPVSNAAGGYLLLYFNAHAQVGFFIFFFFITIIMRVSE